MFRSLIAVGVVTLLLTDTAKANGDDTGITTRPTFSGRLGATKLKIVIICAVPNAPVEVAPAPREVVVKTDSKIDEKKLRQLADPWSGGLPDKRKKDLEELMRDLPPKYRQMVKDYFDQVEKASREKK